MKVAFYTLGCKVNQYETEAMREAFAAAGHTVVPDSAPFDAIVINSCTVTAESDRKTRQTVRRFRKERPDAAVILTGCMVQAFSSEAKALSEADIIAGNTDVKKIVEYAEKFLLDGEKIFKVQKHKKEERFNTPSLTDFAERTRAYMKIEDGCERFCTYCIIPTARGFVRSKPLDEIKKEAENLSRAGFSEIVLVGINLTSYGKDEGFDLADAVDAVCSVEGIKRVRLGSLEPDHMSDEMLSRFKNQEKFCPQFHLSLQSGCDETLKRMNRHYDTAFYRDLVSRIRRSFENAAITTDIMVGFAGETEEEFEKSLAFAREIGFAKAHIFAYSRRAGTVAYALPNQVSNAEKARRSRFMSEATLKTENEFLSSLAGKVFPVLFESAQDGFAEGYTANYSRVRVQSDKPHTGEILNVKIIKAEKDYCLGEFV
ncbi:MAG: tRNA (N(6)-L-threonylcarbamoyladenosine(37)-C(2))-methylthiotransferase MtaB [Acutalibacteraceae bacterium]